MRNQRFRFSDTGLPTKDATLTTTVELLSVGIATVHWLYLDLQYYFLIFYQGSYFSFLYLFA